VDKRLLGWLKSNRQQSFESPRGTIFKTKTQRFKINKLDEPKGIVEIEFSKVGTVLRLEFWRFETALDLIERNRGKWTRLGTRIDSDDPDTIEWQIQKKARQIHPKRHMDLKSAPHVCDIFVLAGIAEYGKAINPSTRRKNQALRLVAT